jgi:hypothetical protein
VSGEIGDAEGRLLEQWIRPTLGDAQVGFDDAGPAADATGAGLRVGLRLLDVLPSPTPRGHETPPLRLQARYAVTVSGGKTGESRAALADLAFAALGSELLELERATPPVDYWRALALPPRPALVVRLLLVRVGARTRAPLVRVPLSPRWSGLRPLDGMVVIGPDNVGVAGALIELDGQGLATYSDHRGAFHFAAVPDEPAIRTIIVQAKGRRLAFQAKRGPKPVVLTLPLPES